MWSTYWGWYPRVNSLTPVWVELVFSFHQFISFTFSSINHMAFFYIESTVDYSANESWPEGSKVAYKNSSRHLSSVRSLRPCPAPPRAPLAWVAITGTDETFAYFAIFLLLISVQRSDARALPQQDAGPVRYMFKSILLYINEGSS